MIGFDELNILPDAVVILFEKYQTSVILDIARRLARLPYMSSTAAWQMARLIQSGGVYDYSLDQLERTTGMSRLELVDAFKKAGVRTLNYDNNLYKLAGFKPINLNLSPAMIRVLQSGFEKTFGAMVNLTRTTALQSEQLFIEASDLAYQQIVTGAFDYNRAIKQAVIDVAEQGVRTVSYPSGRKHQLDVAVRRTVLTGVGQTAAGVQMINLGEMGTDLVQVSAHIGARNVGEGPKNHESWQGKIYSISGDHKKYGSFLDITGFGTGEGLHGWNCVVGNTKVSGSAISSGYRREYSGEIIILTTAGGKELSITPNHPILSEHGWVPAGLLREGDNIFSRTNLNRVEGVSPDIDKGDPRIQDVFCSMLVDGVKLSVPGSSGNFHGDIGKHEIDVVFPKSLLRDGIRSEFQKKIIEVFFSFPTSLPGSLSRFCPFDQVAISPLHTSDSIVGRSSKQSNLSRSHTGNTLFHSVRSVIRNWYTKFLKISSNRTFRNAGSLSNLIFPHSGIVHPQKFFGFDAKIATNIGFPITSFINPVPFEAIDNCLGGTSVLDGNGGWDDSGTVELDNIINIERKSTKGSFVHVYNLETKGGWYFGNGVILKNCRHSFYPFFEGLSIKGPVDPKDYKGKTVKYKGEQIDYYKATQIQRGIERAIRKEKRVALALGAADLGHRIYNQKIRWLQAKMREFIRETGLNRHREREQVRY